MIAAPVYITSHRHGGLRHREMGAGRCYVGTGIGMAANKFYAALGFREIQRGWYWEKVFPGN